jgi:hypothetical protein
MMDLGSIGAISHAQRRFRGPFVVTFINLMQSTL